jgi:glycerol-3-phosphate acyltransferase PlsY
MIDILKIAAAFTAGYLLGSINTAVIVGRLYGKDVKNLGSKSGGLTNALRVLGKTAAIFVLVSDVLKGVIACLIGSQLAVYAQSGEARDCVSLLAAGAGAIVGHNWPVYFGFKGGKGVLTGVSVLFVFDWRMALICLGLFAAITAATRYVSLANICATLFFVALSFVPAFGHTIYFLVFACLTASIVVFKHRENIQRLLLGTENRLAY